ncbi:hypothetical protein CHS0354_011775 [Potamilus streckersoni]|uniref:ABC transporter family G domain-containing protein n=1 Tax=Potamilus streckersoni TaxID=2493646 RepID=A0AAE0WCT2_9BIVA|nr:hypothetical protein CHS0354_011775 [Potamilus streckersoni]
MQQLRKLADERNKIIIFSIHQPSSQMYHMFDKLLLLAQGKVAFVGHRSDALMHLEHVGFKCDVHYNPADFIMGILKSDESAIKRLTDTAKKRHDTCCLNGFPPNRTSDYSTQGVTNQAFDMEESVQIATRDSSDQRTVKETLQETKKWPTYFSTQLHMLSWRTFKVSRGRILHLYELLQSIILAVALGLVFFQVPHTIGSIRDRMGLLYVCVTYWTFAPAMDAISSCK